MMSPLIIAMAIFALGWRLRQVEGGRVYNDDRIGAWPIICGIILVTLMALRYFGVT